MTAASFKYVSICSGDKSSNSFTAALLDELEKPGRASVEEIFKAARKRDRSFTNIPHISSFSKPFESAWEKWVSVTDPAGQRDVVSEMEAKNECTDCAMRKIEVIDNVVNGVAKSFSDKAAELLFRDYKDAVARQPALTAAFSNQVKQAFRELTDTDKYKPYTTWSYSKALFYADLHNVPALSFKKTKDKTPSLSDETQEFLKSAPYIDAMTKLEMSSAMASKGRLQDFVRDLQSKVTDQQKSRDGNRARIQELAIQILELERSKYSKSFQSQKGNICQRFVI